MTKFSKPLVLVCGRALARGLALVAFVLGSSLGLACENPSGPERALSGKRIYDRNCARCHGLEGRPTKEAPGARDLSNLSYMNSLSDDQIRGMIDKGKPPAMPSFGGRFVEPSMKVLIAYTRSLSDLESTKLNQAESPVAE